MSAKTTKIGCGELAEAVLWGVANGLVHYPDRILNDEDVERIVRADIKRRSRMKLRAERDAKQQQLQPA